MLRTQNALTPHTHTARAGLEPDAAGVAVHGPDRFVKDAQAKHRDVG